MPKGAKCRVTLTLDTFKCYRCDIVKKFQTEKMRDKYETLHLKFCGAIQAGCIDTINYGGTKKADVFRHK